MPGQTPKGLSYDEKETLARCVEAAAELSLYELLTRSESHVRTARLMDEADGLTGLKVAESVLDRIKRIICEWELMPEQARPWLKGAMLYFAHTQDGYGDFDSPVGFDDDVNVLNACLRMVDREELCLDLEAFG